MERLLAKDAILTLLTELAYAQDELDRPLMRSLFAPGRPVWFDISSHLAQYTPRQVSADELMDEVTGAIAGYTATQHLLGNQLITFGTGEAAEQAPTSAHAKVQVCAYHCIQEEGRELQSVTSRGTWNIDVVKVEGRWVLERIVIRRPVPMDNPDLYKVSKERTVRRAEKTAE